MGSSGVGATCAASPLEAATLPQRGKLQAQSRGARDSSAQGALFAACSSRLHAKIFKCNLDHTGAGPGGQEAQSDDDCQRLARGCAQTSVFKLILRTPRNNLLNQNWDSKTEKLPTQNKIFSNSRPAHMHSAAFLSIIFCELRSKSKRFINRIGCSLLQPRKRIALCGVKARLHATTACPSNHWHRTSQRLRSQRIQMQIAAAARPGAWQRRHKSTMEQRRRQKTTSLLHLIARSLRSIPYGPITTLSQSLRSWRPAR